MPCPYEGKHGAKVAAHKGNRTAKATALQRQPRESAHGGPGSLGRSIPSKLRIKLRPYKLRQDFLQGGAGETE